MNMKHTFPPINSWAHLEIIMIILKKAITNKCKKKLGIIAIKSKETRVATYTCRYSNGHLIPPQLN